ncbi:hypothetical protein L6164_037344 [Bauhinia variegata]|uniref:Uncharacterized protein n=1 Tax=Bauhinia variegata TaxID=167791 RepID=A0ACB9KJQ5_BAUVA|nr:hypothetical protein L6164_037344 [Bauhinia variegata]
MQVSWPSLSCPSSNNTKFWSHEWEKHGTCAESAFDQHKYFEAALNLKDSVDLLQVLKNAGIEPVDGKLYSLDSIKEAIQKGVGFVPRLICNKDLSKTSQLKEVYLCADKNASTLIECPVTRGGNCPSKIEFPSFGSPTPAGALISSS